MTAAAPDATPDPWHALRQYTPARIALGRAGASLPTAEWLRFGLAHALARDAVHWPLDTAALATELRALGLTVHLAHSAAADRATYLRRPDLGRQLAAASLQALQQAAPATGGLAVMVGDGLSALAVHHHAAPLLQALQTGLPTHGWALGPVVIASQARVALGDVVGEALKADAVLVLIGERPGLSSPDSLGAYLTWAPRPGCSDAGRNCVSNIRPQGLSFGQAARTIGWLLAAARRLGCTGVRLKDESDAPGLQATSPPAVQGPA